MTLVAGFDLWYEAEQARALPSVREFMGHLPASVHFFLSATTQEKLPAEKSKSYPDSKNGWREVTCYNDTVDGQYRGEL